MSRSAAWKRATLAAAGLAAIGLILLLLRHAGPPNVLLITLDTTRADHLGCYGHRGALTPNLDRLASEGALFERACCAVPLTLPSHSTVLTGLYPPEHGLRVNTSAALPTEAPLMQTILKGRGYATGAFIASPVLAARFGLSRGFDVYDDLIHPAATRGNERRNPYRSGDDVTDAAIAWLKSGGSRRFFCWVHLYDPHFPYYPHKEAFGERFAGNPYDAEIAFADLQVGRLTTCLDSMRMRKRTLIVVVGDHGESLEGEAHFEPEPHHGLMVHDNTMRVPLIFVPSAARKSWPAGTRLSDPVSLVDILPTVLGFLGFDTPAGCSGVDLSKGTDPERLVYGETMLPSTYGWSGAQSLTGARWKYVRTAKPELYDLAGDSREEVNLADSMGARVAELDARLTERETAMIRLKGRGAAPGAEERRAIEALGYVSGGSEPAERAVAGSGRDIEDLISALFLAAEAEAFSRAGKAEEAVRVWRKVVEGASDCIMFRNGLACALIEGGFAGEALKEMDEIGRSIENESERSGGMKSHRMYPTFANNRACALNRLGRAEEALSYGLEAVKLDPMNGSCHHTVAESYKALGRTDDALRYAREAYSLNPYEPEHPLLLAEILAEKGATDEAASLARRVLDMECAGKYRARALAVGRESIP